MDVMIDGTALQNPGSECLESNLNPLFSGAKQLVTYQGAFDGCHFTVQQGEDFELYALDRLLSIVNYFVNFFTTLHLDTKWNPSE